LNLSYLYKVAGDEMPRRKNVGRLMTPSTLNKQTIKLLQNIAETTHLSTSPLLYPA